MKGKRENTYLAYTALSEYTRSAWVYFSGGAEGKARVNPTGGKLSQGGPTGNGRLCSSYLFCCSSWYCRFLSASFSVASLILSSSCFFSKLQASMRHTFWACFNFCCRSKIWNEKSLQIKLQEEYDLFLKLYFTDYAITVVPIFPFLTYFSVREIPHKQQTQHYCRTNLI